MIWCSWETGIWGSGLPSVLFLASLGGYVAFTLEVQISRVLISPVAC